MKIYRREESSLYQGKKKDIHKRTDIQKRKKQNNRKQKKTQQQTYTIMKLRNLYTGNIHPTPTHMIAEPFDSSVRMK